MNAKKKSRWIQGDNLPPRIFPHSIVVYWLLLDRFDAAGWVYGAVFTVLGLCLLAEWYRFFNSEAVDLVGNAKGTAP